MSGPRSIRRGALTAATLAAVALLASACASAGAAPAAVGRTGTSAADDLSSVSLTVGIQNSGSSAELDSLKASGVLDDTPYSVKLADFPGADGAVEALNAGAIDVDIALNSSAPVLAQANAQKPWTSRSAAFKVVGAVERPDDSGIAIVVRNGAGVTGLKDLAGRKVTFAKGTANHYYFALAAKKAGLDTKKVDVVTIPLAEARSAYVSGSVDAIVTAVSNARPLVAENDSKILSTSKGQFTNYQFLVARTAVLKNAASSKAIGDLLLRLQKANEWRAKHASAIAAIYAKDANQSEADAKLSAKESLGSFVPIDAAVYRTQQSQEDVFFEQKVAKTKVDVKLGFDTRYNALLERH